MSEPKPAGEFLRQLTAAEYARISDLLDQSLDMIPGDREVWLTTLQRSDPKSAALLRNLFAVQGGTYDTGQFLEVLPPLFRPPAALDTDSALVGKQFGPYRVLSLLGHGGMGSVWRAERVDGLFKRQVALKLIHTALVGRVTAERFAREREILASLNHPNIARLLDAGISAEGQPYLALEYIDGTPLSLYCDERKLSLHERLELFRQVLLAVEYAHGHLVIHRDLKSSNILVSADGRVHLLDFGIAKLLTEGQGQPTELTQLGGRAMTPDYAAPEQILGATVSIAADVYSLGVMLYDLLTGERPYRLKQESRGALEQAILETEPIAASRANLTEAAAQARSSSVRKLQRALRGDLETMLFKALKKRPHERYPTINAFVEDISRYLRGDPILARRDTFGYRAMKFAQRHWVGIAVVAILLLTLLGGLAATSYEARVAAKQRDNALEANRRALIQAASARLLEGDVPGALGIILDVLRRPGPGGSFTPEALNVFQEARAADLQLLAITGHTDRVRSVAISPDGKRIVTASYDDTARIWDAQTGQQIRLLARGSDHFICVAFSPDGGRIATASYDRTARIWDATTGRQVLVLSGHTDRLRALAFSTDGRRLGTTSYDKTARIWDAATGRQLVILKGHDELVTGISFSPDGRLVVTASYDKTARIWDAASGRELRRLLGHTDRVTSAAFSPDGLRVVTASGDKSGRVWEVATGRDLVQLRGHSQLLASAVFSVDGTSILTASYDNTARIWNAATGQEVMLLNGHTGTVESAVFSPDGARAITAASDKTVRVWNLVGRQVMRLEGHTDAIPSALYSDDGRRVITGAFDKTARVWDAMTGQPLTQLIGHAQRVTYADFSRDAKRAVTASTDGTARVWDVQTGRALAILKGHTEAVLSAGFSPNGKYVVTASLDNSARVWDAASGQQLVLLRGHDAPVEHASFSPDGRRVATASNDKTARLWDAASGQPLMVFNGHTDVVERVEFFLDGRRLVTASDDRTARIWDVATGREILTLTGHSGSVPDASASADGRFILTASNDKTARLWDASTGAPVLVLRHPDQVEGARFSPDGTRIVTASDDGVARIWDVRVPPVDQQIRWVEAAQFDSLSSAERFQLGLLAPTHIRPWPADRSRCDESAGAPYDPDRHAPGVLYAQIVGDIAMQACGTEQRDSVGEPRWVYEHGRALLAIGDIAAARHAFERAIDGRYRAARVDLAMLLTRATGLSAADDNVLDSDVRKAIELYEQAWREGITIAAFQLGRLYELGIPARGNRPAGLAPESQRAWEWYQRGAAALEPNALARLAERDSAAAFGQSTAASRNSYLMSSFRYYSAAAERARSEDWPDEIWVVWRYRRASLARMLESEGMLKEVGDAYAAILRNTS